jgi:hypothetical protein
MPRKMLGIKIFNEINGPNQSAISFGAVFMSRCMRGVGSAPRHKGDCIKQRCSACAGFQLLGVLGWQDRCEQR